MTSTEKENNNFSKAQLISHVLFRYFIYRWKELLVWLGIPTLGVFLAMEDIQLGQFACFLLATTILMWHILIFNDWSGLVKNPYEVARVKLDCSEPWRKRALLIGTLLTGLLSIVLYMPLGSRLLQLSLVLIFFSTLYSHPKIHLKEGLWGSPLIHFLGGEVKFLLGYLLFSDDILKGGALGLFFAVVFTAGNFVHQCRDFDEDAKVGLQTAAITYGIRPIMTTAIVLFMTSHLYLLVLLLHGQISWVVSLLFTVPMVEHIRFIVVFIQNRKDSGDLVTNYQRRYRILYAVAMLLTVALNL